MKLSDLISESIKIIPILYSDDKFYDSNGYSVWEQAAAIASSSGINIFRNKDLAFAAVDENGDVQGAIWKAIYKDDEHGEEDGHGEDDVWVYDFDVAVKREIRTKGLRSELVGVKLIDAAIDDFRMEKSEFGNMYVKVWVVNPKLAKWLEYKRGFEPVGIDSKGTGTLTLYN